MSSSFCHLQAFLIAFTSDFLPRLLYQYKFDNDLNGYINFTLAHAPLNYTEYPLCRYTVRCLSECLYSIDQVCLSVCFFWCNFGKKSFLNLHKPVHQYVLQFLPVSVSCIYFADIKRTETTMETTRCSTGSSSPSDLDSSLPSRFEWSCFVSLFADSSFCLCYLSPTSLCASVHI